MEQSFTRSELIRELTQSKHGRLDTYIQPVKAYSRGLQVADEEFLARVIAWNERKGQIRDSKVALPTIHWAHTGHRDFQENAQAHLALRSPRDLLSAWRFARSFDTPVGVRQLNNLVRQYLRYREARPHLWTRAALQHRTSMKSLYALSHTKPSAQADKVLFRKQYAPGSVFADLRNMPNMDAKEIAAAIAKHKIPFLPLRAALGGRLKDKDVVFALIANMSPTELVTNQRLFEAAGVKTDAALRHAYREALARVADNTTANVLKTSAAAEAIDDTEIRDVLRQVQQKQIEKSAGIEGNWVVFVDKSSSMEVGIEAGMHIAAHLAAMVKGNVHVLFFDSTVRFFDATGKSLVEIKEALSHVRAGGSTNLVPALRYLEYNKLLDFDGCAVVSDGEVWDAAEFAQEYKRLLRKMGERNIPLYFYHVGEWGTHLKRGLEWERVEFTRFDLTGANVDYYAIPNLVQTMRTNPFSLSDEIMATPLLTLKDVFK